MNTDEVGIEIAEYPVPKRRRGFFVRCWRWLRLQCVLRERETDEDYLRRQW